MGEAASIGGEPSEFAHRIWPAHPRHLAHIRSEVRRWLGPLALTGDNEDDLVLAVNEAVSNSVEHAYRPATLDGTVELTFWTELDAVCVEVVDHGEWRIPPGQPTGRGRGIEIMQRLVAFVLIRHDRRGTRVLLRHLLLLGGPSSRCISPPARRRPARQRAILSERELTVLGLLPSLLSLDEIAVDLTVSVNTVKSDVRSIYMKLGVSSRRLAVLTAHEHGLLSSAQG
jgi:serine/threonine-protein kinase RsbW